MVESAETLLDMKIPEEGRRRITGAPDILTPLLLPGGEGVGG